MFLVRYIITHKITNRSREPVRREYTCICIITKLNIRKTKTKAPSR